MPTRKTEPKIEKQDYIACTDINLNALGGMVYSGDLVSLPPEHPVTKALLSQGKIKAASAIAEMETVVEEAEMETVAE
ncbi:MAG: hypothetical protein F6J95_023595 [Leptolyngbya sp. SIO1E4]|nr:hypothetical protein [Leptolyngbya sp. SIO1E4]